MARKTYQHISVFKFKQPYSPDIDCTFIYPVYKTLSKNTLIQKITESSEDIKIVSIDSKPGEVFKLFSMYHRQIGYALALKTISDDQDDGFKRFIRGRYYPVFKNKYIASEYELDCNYKFRNQLFSSEDNVRTADVRHFDFLNADLMKMTGDFFFLPFRSKEKKNKRKPLPKNKFELIQL